MKKLGIVILLVFLLLVQTFAISALSASGAREEWKEAKEYSREMRTLHREAKARFAGNKTEENKQEVVETGKDVLYAGLDEAEAWLLWKEVEVEENEDLPDDLRESIQNDVEANLDKIDDLRDEVDAIENRMQLGIVFLRMMGKYAELLTDVGRNSGKVWVHIANERADTIEDYEARLRDAAEGNNEAIEKLDMAKDELDRARENIDNAEEVYEAVVAGGQPLRKFAEGNNYLRNARLNLINASQYLRQAFRLIVAGGTE